MTDTRSRMLRVLEIAESTYYGWVTAAGQPCDRELEDRGLLSNIHEIWTASGRTYGADRVHGQLHRDGLRVGRKRVERLMACQGWQGAYLRRGWRGGSTRQDPTATPAADLVNREFTASAPNRLWVADAIHHPAVTCPTRVRAGHGRHVDHRWDPFDAVHIHRPHPVIHPPSHRARGAPPTQPAVPTNKHRPPLPADAISAP